VHLTDWEGGDEGDYLIRLLRADGGVRGLFGTPGVDGSTVFPRVRAGAHRVVAKAKRDGTLYDLGSIVVREGEPQVIEKALAAPGRITIHLLDGSGHPLSGHRVEVTACVPPPLDRLLVTGFRRDIHGFFTASGSAGVWKEVEFITDALGSVEIGPLAPGTYEIRADGRSKRVELPAGGTVVVAP